MTEHTKEKLTYIPLALIVTAIGIFLLTNPKIATDGISSGLTLCAQIVIPSLFPFLFLSSFITKSGLCNKLSFIFEKPTRFLFKLPGCCAGVILMSLIGGFPVGAKMTYELYKNKDISISQAQRMMLFCINPGPAFVISAVGYSMLGNSKIGVILFAALCLSSIIIGIVTGIFSKEDNNDGDTINKKNDNEKISMSLAFTNSAGDATNAMLNICVWVILFSCLSGLLTVIPMSKLTNATILCFLEVTSGCCYAAKDLGVASVAFVLGWSGLCVHCQIMQYIKGVNCKIFNFFVARIACATLCSFLCTKLLDVFPCEAQTFASNSLAFSTSFSVSIPAVIALLFMSAILILDLDTKKEIC